MTAPIASVPTTVPAGVNNAMATAGAGDPLGLFGLLLAGLGLEQGAVNIEAATEQSAGDEGDAKTDAVSADADESDAQPVDAGQTLALLIAAGQALTPPPPVPVTASASTAEAEAVIAAPGSPTAKPGLDLPFIVPDQAQPPLATSVTEAKPAEPAADMLKGFAEAAKVASPAPVVLPPAALATPTSTSPKVEAAQIQFTLADPVAAPVAPPAPAAALSSAAAAQASRPADIATANLARTGQDQRVATSKAPRSEVKAAQEQEAPVVHAKADVAAEVDEQAAPIAGATLRKPAVEQAATTADDKAGPAELKAEPAPLAQAPAAAGPTTAASAAAAPARGSPETVAKLAADIVRKLEGSTTRFEVGLDPVGLGRVEVKVEIGPSGKVHASMTFDNAQAAADVGRRSGELRQALEQAGFDLSGGSLSFDVAGQGGQGRGQAFDQDRSGGRPAQAAFEAALTLGDEAVAIPAWRPTAAVSGVDIRI